MYVTNKTTDSDQEARQSHNLERGPKEFAEARVDIRKFAQFLSGQQVNPMKVICSKFIVSL